MYRELRQHAYRRAGGGRQFDGYILVIVHYTSANLHCFDDRFARLAVERECRSRGQRLTVNEDDCSVRVSLRLNRQRQILPCSRTAVGVPVVVHQCQPEHSSLVSRHITDGVFVKHDLRVFDRHCGIGKHVLPGVVPLRALLALVRAVTRTTLAEEHETAVLLFLAYIRTLRYLHLLGDYALENTVHRCTIDAHGGEGVAVRCNGETYLA